MTSFKRLHPSFTDDELMGRLDEISIFCGELRRSVTEQQELAARLGKMRASLSVGHSLYRSFVVRRERTLRLAFSYRQKLRELEALIEKALPTFRALCEQIAEITATSASAKECCCSNLSALAQEGLAELQKIEEQLQLVKEITTDV